MGDGLGEAKQLGGRGTQVNRVVVAGDPRIATADIRRGLPAGQFADVCRCGLGVIGSFAFEFYASAEHSALGFPQHSERIFDGGYHLKGCALGVRLEVLRVHAYEEFVYPAQWAMDSNAIAQVDQPQQREGKCLGREQLHLQSKRQDVWVGRR